MKYKALVLAALATAAFAGHANAASCVGGSSLKGRFAMLVSGASLTSGSGKYLSGSLNFDGNCGITAQNVSGGINGSVATTTATGTYAAGGASNSITMTLTPTGQAAQTYTIGRSVGGLFGLQTAAAYGLETDGTATATIVLRAQTPPLFGYNTTVVRGTYQLACTGANQSDSDLNTITFNGAGGITGLDVFNNGGGQGSGAITGTYKVASDGTVSAVLTGNFTGYAFTGVFSGGTSKLDYTYTYSNQGEVVACSGSL